MPARGSGGAAPLLTRILRSLNLRFPTLFGALALLTAADVLVPDLIPFADEIGLALLTLLVGLWKDRRSAPRDSTPPAAPR